MPPLRVQGVTRRGLLLRADLRVTRETAAGRVRVLSFVGVAAGERLAGVVGQLVVGLATLVELGALRVLGGGGALGGGDLGGALGLDAGDLGPLLGAVRLLLAGLGLRAVVLDRALA